MAKLPKSIIKKYGISKKAWQVYRGQSRSSKRGTTKQMAKKRYARIRRVAKALDPVKILIGAGIYGAVREPIASSEVFVNLTNKIPLGGVTDEVILLALGWFGYKKGKGIVRDISLGALSIEGARIGEQIRKGTLLTGVSSNGASTGSTFASLG